MTNETGYNTKILDADIIGKVVYLTVASYITQTPS